MRLSRPEAICLRNLVHVAQLKRDLGDRLSEEHVRQAATTHGLGPESAPKLLQLLGLADLQPEEPEERSNRTIGTGEASDAYAVQRVYDRTRALMRLVPKAGMGCFSVNDPSGWRVEITRGESGCGDAHRFHVVALRGGGGVPGVRYDSELLIVARRGEVHVDMPGITVERVGEHGWGRIREMVARTVGVVS